jgi:hypothetical protein
MNCEDVEVFVAYSSCYPSVLLGNLRKSQDNCWSSREFNHVLLESIIQKTEKYREVTRLNMSGFSSRTKWFGSRSVAEFRWKCRTSDLFIFIVCLTMLSVSQAKYCRMLLKEAVVA